MNTTDPNLSTLIQRHDVDAVIERVQEQVQAHIGTTDIGRLRALLRMRLVNDVELGEIIARSDTMALDRMLDRLEEQNRSKTDGAWKRITTDFDLPAMGLSGNDQERLEMLLAEGRLTPEAVTDELRRGPSGVAELEELIDAAMRERERERTRSAGRAR